MCRCDRTNFRNELERMRENVWSEIIVHDSVSKCQDSEEFLISGLPLLCYVGTL